MGHDTVFRQHAIEAAALQASSKLARTIDPLAYSCEFERRLLPEISLLQSTLDYVAMQLQGEHPRRILTQLEHYKLALAELAFSEAEHLNLGIDERLLLARSFLAEAIRAALRMLSGSSHSLEQTLKRLSNGIEQRGLKEGLLPWYDTQVISDLLDYSSPHCLRLKPDNLVRQLHFLCQLSVFTSVPKSPEDYPLTILVKPHEYFSLTTMWARMPQLWEQEVMITGSGRTLVLKTPGTPDHGLRNHLGLLADVQLKLAQEIRLSLPPACKLRRI